MAELAGELEERDGWVSGMVGAEGLPLGVEGNDGGASQGGGEVRELGGLGGGDQVGFQGAWILGIHEL